MTSESTPPRLRPFERPAVTSYDPADWPYGRDVEAEKEWDEIDELTALGTSPRGGLAGDEPC